MTLPPGTQASLHITLTYDDGSSRDLEEKMTVADQPQVGTITNVSHQGGRTASKVVGYIGIGGMGVGLGLFCVGFAINGTLDNPADPSWYILGSTGMFAGLLTVLVGVLIPHKPDDQSFTVDASSALVPSTESSDALDRPFPITLRGFGIIPLRGGGGAGSAVFAF
ncbi:MAG: hypothetical protein ACYDCL_15105 [Myxococcales bacterium]